MSQLAYPSLPGLAYGVRRSAIPPKTRVFTTPSDREYRARDATIPRYEYELAYEFLRSASAYQDLQTLVGFYNQMGAEFDTFLFLDPDDCTANNEALGTAIAGQTAFPLYRAFGGFSEPVDETGGLYVQPFINGVPVNALYGASFEVDSNADGIGDGWTLYSYGTTGTITPSIPVDGSAPSGTHVQQLLASGLGDWPTTNSQVGIYQSFVRFPELTPFRFACTVNSSLANQRVQLQLNFYDAVGNVTGSIFQESGVTSTYTSKAVTGVSPANTFRCDVFILMRQNSGSTQASGINIDAANFYAYTSTAYTYGATSGKAPFTSSGGVLTFNTAPGAGAVVTWSGGFYRRCRFHMGQMDSVKFMSQLWDTKSVKLISAKA